MTKVFGIGMHKTGTSSLGKALSILGYVNCFGANGLRSALGGTKMMGDLFKKDYKEIFEYAEQFTAFNDLPWSQLYKELDTRFPDSKFILTIRDEQAWLSSCIRYFGNTNSAFRLWLYGKPGPIGNEDIYVQRYNKHNREVTEYFSNRNDFLILNMDAGDKWKNLCNFLQRPIPDCDYPHLNSSHTRIQDTENSKNLT